LIARQAPRRIQPVFRTSELQFENHLHIQSAALPRETALIAGDFAEILRIAEIDGISGTIEEIAFKGVKEAG
jgi:hypothetical protein